MCQKSLNCLIRTKLQTQQQQAQPEDVVCMKGGLPSEQTSGWKLDQRLRPAAVEPDPASTPLSYYTSEIFSNRDSNVMRLCAVQAVR